MAKNIYLETIGRSYVAALADGEKLLEYHVERAGESSIVGNIYKGQVATVLGGMQAAFVNIGLDRNAYLFVDEINADTDDVRGMVSGTLDIREGDEIAVQIVKDPSGNKGAKCSPHLSFAGRYLVYVPDYSEVSVSRKIEDEEIKERLAEWVRSIAKKDEGGFIVRTAAENVGKRELKKEAEALRDLYKKTLEKLEKATAPALVHEEGDLVTRMLRDVYSQDVTNIYVGERELYDELRSRSKDAYGKADIVKKSVLFDKPTDMFGYFGLSAEVDKLLRNRVELSNGAYIIIDKTEALTAIDVNTGKYTGENNLEETVYKTNLIAAEEIARQVRLRNIGGIVVVDFIDMELAEHREEVVKALEKALRSDRSKCKVLGMSALGLVEFTRTKKREETASKLVQPCPYCRGDGLIYSNVYVVLKIRAALLDVFAEGHKSAVIDLNAEIAEYVLSSAALRADANKIWKDKRIYLIPHRTYHTENFRIRGEDAKIPDLPEKARLLK
ncbi:MAG: Rne/Rng family ribonuclease [Clostridia bacterium]|nr:Rne/Rng family ribonuclease [Clostridia bacterium]